MSAVLTNTIKINKKPNINLSGFVFGAFNQLRAQDKFGAPVAFNYKGKETFQTVPGALISIIMNVFMIAYMIIKFMALMENSDWTSAYSLLNLND